MATGDEQATALPPGALRDLEGMVGTVLVGEDNGAGLRIGIACSRFNGSITWRLLEGALAGLDECGVDRRDVKVAWAPGAFELPLVAKVLATHGAVDAVISLGAVIRGETGHYDLVAGECAAGVQRVQLDTGVPVAFGVLTLTERKVLGRFQFRPGPNRVGPGGSLQFVADGLKLLLKEEIIPDGTDRLVYLVAPMISLVMSLLSFAVIPWGPPIHIFGQTVPMLNSALKADLRSHSPSSSRLFSVLRRAEGFSRPR